MLSHWGSGYFFPIDPVPVFIVTKSQSFPKTDGGWSNPIGDDDFKVALAIVHELSAIAMSLPFGVNVDRAYNESRVFLPRLNVLLAAGLADTDALTGNICPVVLRMLLFFGQKFDRYCHLRIPPLLKALTKRQHVLTQVGQVITTFKKGKASSTCRSLGKLLHKYANHVEIKRGQLPPDIFFV